ncbi:hypothetical protein [Aureispira anguillae]|uniref:Uncharacterized protein n=1 Tax=Aureispira anguillae TaxID=2864201 RepID=A0A915YCC4_9BACT|nr:hypothetical protein [Aureispira anguillae]BDS10473.1 hypothetical protein AsAng_0011810 [Aureispira anguillae]
MRTLLLTWIIVLVTVGLGMTQTQKTFVKTFLPEEDCPFAVFAIDGTTEMHYWDEPTVRITYTIQTNQLTEKDLETITKNGRYQIEMKFYEEARVMIFDMPKQEQYIFINEEKLEEHLDFEIFLPKGIRYRIVNPTVHPLM